MATAVCGGSYKDNYGTAGFTIQCWANANSQIIGAHSTPRYPGDLNPYQSELGGILAIVIVSNNVANFHDIQDGTMEVGCEDCKSGITATFEHLYDTPKQPHHDLIHEIRQKIASSKIKWKFRYVRGHQDNHVSYQCLDMWGKSNVKMESLAKAYWNKTHATAIPFYPQLTFVWGLWIGDHKLSSWN
jgi:hypothetical protein